MYKIKHIKNKKRELNYIELKSFNSNSSAKIFLELGASLQELLLNNNSVIKDLYPLKYESTYASAILFPFASRIKDGEYTFKQRQYQFDINQKEENNALHGLIFNKKFNAIEEDVSKDYASITLTYTEIKRDKGFPYTYSIQLNYILTAEELRINVLIKNTDTKSFPFTIGWHPYFYSSDLYNSYLNFDSNKKLLFDERMIPVGIEDIKNENKFEIKNKKLDDCFILNTNEIQFKTPDYSLVISTFSKENFLQLYTPKKSNTIAIEPTTGISDSFNNKLGLQVLNAGKSYDITWSVKLNKNES